MKVYFVRHGQSQANLEAIHQDGKGPLSEKGKQQAKEVAKRFANIQVDVIIASDYRRAYDTAQAIAKVVNHRILTSELLREIKMPTEIEGRKHSDPVAIEVRKQISDNLDNPNWRYSDEERFEDISSRAKKFIEELEKRPEENILCVAHGEIIRNIIMTMILENEYIAKIYKINKKRMYLENTGITVCELKDKEWKLIAWGDSSHLG